MLSLKNKTITIRSDPNKQDKKRNSVVKEAKILR